ncbi:MAG: SpoIVB peptidase S55 domain-containing protein [Bacilli bacterium]
MKKLKIFIISLLLLIPINVFAYSDFIIPGGETLGIEINSKGIMVIGFYQINGKYNKGNPELKPGDYITKVNNIDVYTVDDLTSVIEDNISKSGVKITYNRNGKIKTSNLELVKDDNIYKTGLYVKDSITGIGTLSYIDPETKVFGALGHEIVESNTKSTVEIKSGIIFRNYITSIDKSTNGIPGSKNAKFYYDTTYGRIIKNTNVGIYGIYDALLPQKDLIEVAEPNEVKIGKAYIETVLNGEEIKQYDINITGINESSDIKNINFEIIDEELLDKTGGVVQGMSGSPIIQNNKIIGAVTHVVIDNPSNGYGIFITTMLEEGEK